jgi:pimeloyl-ACP methyl ester carboxylesterase
MAFSDAERSEHAETAGVITFSKSKNFLKTYCFIAEGLIFTKKIKAMEKQLKFQQGEINYFVDGEGIPVVLLHGFLENIHVWDDFIDFLKPDFKIIAIDLPGFGGSSVFSDNHTMPFMAEAVKGVLEAENISQAILVGHSMGGYVSLAFARRFPETVRGLVLFHSHAAADDRQGKENRSRTIEVVKQDHKDFITQFIPLLFARENVLLFADEINGLKVAALQTSKEGVLAALAGMRDRDDHLDTLKTATFPLFFVVGKQDSRIPLEKIAPQMTLPAHAESMILDKTGHMGFVESPGKIFPALRDFFRRC